MHSSTVATITSTMTWTRIAVLWSASAATRKPQATSESASCCAAVVARSSGSRKAIRSANATSRATVPRALIRWCATSLDADRLDAVADLDAVHDVHARGHQAEIRVLVVEELRVFLDHKPLAFVIDLGVPAARDADGP